MAELQEKVSQYIGFKPNEIHPPITEENRQEFHKIIADQEKMMDILLACTVSQAEKVLINPSENLPEKLLAYTKKRFEEVSLMPVLIR
ncbi:hypothetical protein C1645_820652 [Glomus cerebriforme]|uniref:Uncharacterized protein n=1 Tax=Glomus cerebriforme TaxID=658196 RepID=A0A397T216_9GLOM|nr:hypothetical protein C1645_820652 [Glomus cerebriforme]